MAVLSIDELCPLRVTDVYEQVHSFETDADALAEADRLSAMSDHALPANARVWRTIARKLRYQVRIRDGIRAGLPFAPEMPRNECCLVTMSMPPVTGWVLADDRCVLEGQFERHPGRGYPTRFLDGSELVVPHDCVMQIKVGTRLIIRCRPCNRWEELAHTPTNPAHEILCPHCHRRMY